MTTFEQAEEVLKRCFGHDGFRPEQERAIKAIMGKRDVLAVMSTGAGKSLIYQVPAVALGGTSIVVSPLVSLMSDQVGKLLDLGLHPAFLNNTLSLRSQETVRNRIKNGEFQILYVAPERLSNPAFLSAIKNLRRSPSSPSTRPTASANGAMTSAATTARSARSSSGSTSVRPWSR